jgi:hypothetical protein
MKYISRVKEFSLSTLRVWIHFQASEDAKKLVDEERAFARSEIDNARAAVQRVEESLQEHERVSQASGKQVCAFSCHFPCHKT